MEPSWSSWSNMYRFQIDDNTIDGVIPDTYTGWDSVIVFDISNNAIT